MPSLGFFSPAHVLTTKIFPACYSSVGNSLKLFWHIKVTIHYCLVDFVNDMFYKQVDNVFFIIIIIFRSSTWTTTNCFKPKFGVRMIIILSINIDLRQDRCAPQLLRHYVNYIYYKLGKCKYILYKDIPMF